MSVRLGLLSAALLLPLAACSGAASEDGRPTVVASIYPLQYVAERVAGDHAAVTTLARPGQEAHDLELGVEKTAEVADADLLVYGAGFQPAVDDAAESLEDDALVEALTVLDEREPAIRGARPVTVLDGDPHFWLDPRALATVAAELGDRLAALDPDHAEDYRESTAALVADLVALDGEMATGLEECERRTVVVSHDAFGYLGYRYDLELAAIAGLSPEAEPSPAHLAELQRLAEAEGVTTVFSETLASPELSETLADSLGIGTAVLDPVEGLGEETEDEDYLSLMRANLEALRAANGCR